MDSVILTLCDRRAGDLITLQATVAPSGGDGFAERAIPIVGEIIRGAGDVLVFGVADGLV